MVIIQNTIRYPKSANPSTMMTQWWLPLAEVSRLRGTALGLAVIAPILRRARRGRHR